MKTHRFSEIMTASLSPTPVSSSPPRYAPVPQSDDVAEAQAHILHIFADSLACIAFGAFSAMWAEGLTAGRLDGFRLAMVLAGSAGVATRLAGSRTIHEWRDWAADVFFAQRMQDERRERHEFAFQRVQVAQSVASDLSHQPSAEDELINRVLVRVLGDYYSIVGQGKIPGKLWSRRTLASRYGLGEFTRANSAIRDALAPLEDGQSLKPSTFDAAFIALFGTEPRRLKGPLVRLGQNPARREPVFAAVGQRPARAEPVFAIGGVP
jgi:hypothetical protein